jgi:hypothetical protein
MYDLNKIKNELKILPKWGDQICLQGTETIKDPFAGIGSARNLQEREREFVYPLFDIPYINSIIKEHELHRVRLMRLKSKTCYSYHQDQNKRFHIPIISNDDCFFVIEEEIKRYPADGNWYLIDTTKKHTAINASWEDRIHLIGNLNTKNNSWGIISE